MALEGIGGSSSINENNYTMESLGIKEGSVEASIFNKIDMSDGNKDNNLTAEQYEKFQAELKDKKKDGWLKILLGPGLYEIYNKISKNNGSQEVQEASEQNIQKITIEPLLDHAKEHGKIISDLLEEQTHGEMMYKIDNRNLKENNYLESLYPDLKFDADKKTISIESKGIVDFEINTPEQIELLKSKLEEG